MNTLIIVAILVVVISIMIVGFAYFQASSSSKTPSPLGAGSSPFSYPSLGLLSSSNVGSVLGGSWNETNYYQGSNISKIPGHIRIMNVKYLGLASFKSSDPNRTFNITYAEFNSSKAALSIYKLGTTNMNSSYNGIYDGFNYTMLENSNGGVIIFYANYYNYDIVMAYQQNNTLASMPPESAMVNLLKEEVSTSR
jgi:hypothetical protein